MHNGRAEINVDTIDFIALEKMERAKQVRLGRKEELFVLY